MPRLDPDGIGVAVSCLFNLESVIPLAANINIASIHRASERIRDVTACTPLRRSFELSRHLGTSVYLKLESMQDTGSFKIRGAANFVRRASERQNIQSLVAASSGNHGRSVAYLAAQMDLSATICMTTLVPKEKIAGIRQFGAEAVIKGDNQNVAVEEALKHARQSGAIYVPPFDDTDIIAGQGTVGTEILQQQDGIRTLIVPVSGGGLLSGVAVAAKALDPTIKVIGVTCEHDGVMYESMRAGKVVEVQERPSIADALPGPIPLDNRYTFSLCREFVDSIHTVTDASIARAMRFAFDHDKIILEGAGAAGIAFVLDHPELIRERETAIVCSGCNISRQRLLGIFEQFGV